MHFLLINSPLVTSATWIALAPVIEAKGHQVAVVSVDNEKDPGQTFAAHHLAQVSAQLAEGDQDFASTIVVSHSGAGPILATLSSANLAGYIMFDSIFPEQGNSRFDLFDSADAVEAFREAARKSGGLLPTGLLRSFGRAITDTQKREKFESGLVDVPIALYEECMDVPETWPEHPGLYIQWTDAYRFDLQRAARRGFKTTRDLQSHFAMLNEPMVVIDSILDFARTINHD